MHQTCIKTYKQHNWTLTIINKIFLYEQLENRNCVEAVATAVKKSQSTLKDTILNTVHVTQCLRLKINTRIGVDINMIQQWPLQKIAHQEKILNEKIIWKTSFRFASILCGILISYRRRQQANVGTL